MKTILCSISVLLLKAGLFGQVLTHDWSGVYQGSQAYFDKSSAVDASGNIYTVGSFDGTKDFNLGSGVNNLSSFGGTTDSYIVKTSASGTFLWASKMGSNSDFDIATSVSVDAAGNVIVVGDFALDLYYNSTLATSVVGDFRNTFVLKLNPSGGLIWAKGIGNDPYTDIESNCVKVDAANNIYVTGSLYSIADFDPSANSYIVSSVAGCCTIGDPFVFKWDANGNFIWVKKFDNISQDITAHSISMDVSASGDVTVHGRFRQTLDFDPGLGTSLLTSNGAVDAFVCRLNSLGDYQWAFNIGGTGSEWVSSINYDQSGNIIISGSSSAGVDFDPGIGNTTLNQTGNYLAKYTSSGQFIWLRGFSGNVVCTTTNAVNDIFLGLNYNSTFDADPSAGIYNLTLNGSSNLAVVRLNSSGNFLAANSFGGTSANIYPKSISWLGGKLYVSGATNGTVDMNPSTNATNNISGSGSFIVRFCETNMSYPIITETLPANAVCFINNILLGTTIAYTNFNWSTGATTPTISVSPGSYTFNATSPEGCLLSTTYTTLQTSDYNLSQFDYPNGLTIANSSTILADLNGDNIIRVIGPISVSQGVNYLIDSKTIEFADNASYATDPNFTTDHSGIIVNRQANLKVNNSTLRSVGCPGKMWQGIQVVGKSPTTIPNNIAGKLTILRSKVSEARTAVTLYNPHGPNAFYNSASNLYAEQTSFINNNIGVDVASNSTSSNPTIIKYCQFINNALLKDQTLYPGLGSSIFIKMRKVYGIAINSNIFDGYENLSAVNRGTGISSFQAGYSVEPYYPFALPQNYIAVPNSFKDLYKGIDYYSTGGANSATRIRENNFTNVWQGIKAEGGVFGEIAVNRFDIPAATNLLPTWGIYMLSCNGYLMSENVFNSISSNNSFGVINKNSTLALNEIYKNYFPGNLRAGTQIEASNPNLQIKCNEYTGAVFYDWALPTGATLASQGNCSSVTGPTGNSFSWCEGSTNHIHLDPGVTGFIYNSQADRMPTASCVSSGVTLSNCSSYPTTDPILSCPARVRGRSEGGTGSVVAALAILTNTSSVNKMLKMPEGIEKESLKMEILRAMMESDNLKDVIDLLESSNTFGDQSILIPIYLEKGQCEDAKILLNKMRFTTKEGDLFYKYYELQIKLCETNRDNTQLDGSEIGIIEEIAKSEIGISVLAEGILADLKGRTTIERTPQTLIDLKALLIEEDQINEEQNQSTEFSIAPNPSNDYVTISINSATEGKLTIIDMLGRVVFEKQISSTDTKETIDNLPKGLHTVVLTTADGKSFSKKVMILE